MNHQPQPLRARRVICRPSHSDEAVWRDAMGGAEALHPMSTTGAIDAPDWSPAGSMLSTRTGPYPRAVARPGFIGWGGE